MLTDGSIATVEDPDVLAAGTSVRSSEEACSTRWSYGT
ncbi:hypothetical protein QFZ50_003165 [Arthrobacter agilis]|jgi:hypothetical protein|nr:hypothetical protein [Arthrobacter agilis]